MKLERAVSTKNLKHEDRYGRLRIGQLFIRDKRMRAICVCDCGGIKTVIARKLIDGDVRSCGCLARERSRMALTSTLIALKHGATRHGKQEAEYVVWAGMIQRCINPKHVGYVNYGGRGIVVCERWRSSYSNFLQDMGRRPSNKYSIERLENDGPYAPENCKWATKKQQSLNGRRSLLLTFKGETATAFEWASRLGVKYKTLQMRIKRGWSSERALLTPIGGSL